MWEHRCKVAVSGVGFSRVTRSAEIPLAAHALEAVKGAVEDSGLALSDIDGLATYPELPATGHAAGHGRGVHAVAGAAQPEPGEDGDARRDPAPALAHEPPRLLLQGAAHERGLPEFPDGRVPVLSLRLRYPGAGRGRHRPHHRRPR